MPGAGNAGAPAPETTPDTKKGAPVERTPRMKRDAKDHFVFFVFLAALAASSALMAAWAAARRAMGTR